jgi:CHAT domain-containing protein
MLVDLVAAALAAAQPVFGVCGTPPTTATAPPAGQFFDLELASFGRRLQPEDGARCSGMQTLTLTQLYASYIGFGENEDAVRIADVLVHYYEARLTEAPSNAQTAVDLERARLNLAEARARLGDLEGLSDRASLFLAGAPGHAPSQQLRPDLNNLADAALDAGSFNLAHDVAERAAELTRQDLAGQRYFPSNTPEQEREVQRCGNFIQQQTEAMRAHLQARTESDSSDATLAALTQCLGIQIADLARTGQRASHGTTLMLQARADLALGLDADARVALDTLLGAPKDYALAGEATLIMATLLERIGDARWHDVAVRARQEAKIDLGIRDPLASYSGQRIGLDFVVADHNRASLAGLGFARAGESELLLGRPTEALTYFEAAAPPLQATLENGGLVSPRTRYLTGLAWLQLHQPARALPFLASASSSYDAFAPTSRDARSLGQSRFEGAVDIHLAFLEAALAANDAQAIDLAIMRAGRSQISRSFGLSGDKAGPAFERARNAARIATESDRALVRAIAANLPADQIARLASAADTHRREAAVAQTASAAESPANSLFGLAPVMPTATLRALLPAHAGILILVTGQERGFTALLTRTALIIKPVTAPRYMIVEAVRRLRESVTFRPIPQGFAVPAFDARDAAWLYDQLLGPVRAELGPLHRLYISRSYPLDALPFAALRDQNANAWLGQTKALSIILDPSALTATPATPRAYPLGALTIGDPAVTSRNFLRDLTIDAARPLIPVTSSAQPPLLPGAGQELAAIRTAAGGPPSIVGLTATEARFAREATRGYRVIEIASHAVTEKRVYQVPTPAIVFTPVPGGGPANDGLLHPSEIEGLKIPAELVILSACETAGGDGQPGAEALSGLAQSFFYSGARTVLATQWKVDSSTAAELMSASARALRPGADIAFGLRDGIVKVSREPSHGHPAFWAPFVVVDRTIH